MYNMLNKFWLFVKACDICQRTKKEKHEKFVAHLIVMGILKKNSLEQYWSRDSILNMPFFGCYMSRNRFQNILWIFTSVIQMRPTHWREKQTMILCFWLGQWWTWCKEISIQSTGQERNYLWMKACVLLRAESISSVTTPKKPNRFHIKLFMVSEPSTGYICGFEVIQEMHLASHRVMHRKYRMHQKLHALS